MSEDVLLPTPSDTDLLARAAQGETEAFGVLYERYVTKSLLKLALNSSYNFLLSHLFSPYSTISPYGEIIYINETDVKSFHQ